MTLEQAITLLRKWYEKAQKSEYVQFPLAWALYQVWREADKERCDSNDS